ncbi:MAG: hypothetical protein AAF710_02595 [Planctomycetota bacterium]
MRVAWLGLSAVVVGLVGCAAADRAVRVLPDGVERPLREALPVTQGEKVARLGPFTTVWTLDGGLTYFEIDDANAERLGARFRVNGGPWTVAATTRRGDRLDVASYASRGPGAVSSVSYTVYGRTTRGEVQLVEHRWFLDGYPERRRSLRLLPYGGARAATADAAGRW